MQKLILFMLMLFLPVLGYAKSEDEQGGLVIEYVEMEPKFTVNLAEPKKYLLVDIQLQMEGTENVEKAKKHMPRLRHEIIMMLSGMHIVDLQTAEQREALRIKTKALITNILDQIANSDGFRDVFFSEFLVN
ncbi:MAG: flagellar basal body-associated FliL family protein [Gammaproteobacteria bacterium]